ncbi:MAG: FAD-dependent thymidylate synthase, partial [Nanoarchaeota archaeon]
QSAVNKQGRGEVLAETARTAQDILIKAELRQQELTDRLRELNVPEDDIRGTKGVGFYAPRWRMGTLHNWCHYFGLRVDPHAQREIQMYAKAQMDMIERLAPTTIQALKDYRIDTFFFSEPELQMLSSLIATTPRLLDHLETYKPFGFVTGDKEKGTEKLTREGGELQGKLKALLQHHFELLKKEMEQHE